jgi:hypothetical protein
MPSLFGSGTGVLGWGGSGITAKGAGDVASGVGGAVSSLFAGIGMEAEAGQYNIAAHTAETNVDLARESETIQQYQAQRKTNAVIGAQEAAIGASGFSESGSALDLLRDSVTQGHLTQSMIGVQGEVNAASYQQQAQSAKAEAAAAGTAATGDFIGSALKGVGAIGSIAAML